MQAKSRALTRQHSTLSELPPLVPFFNGMPMADDSDSSALNGGSKLQHTLNVTRDSLDVQLKKGRGSTDLQAKKARLSKDLAFSRTSMDTAQSMFQSSHPSLLQHTTAVVMSVRSEVQPGSPVVSGVSAKKSLAGKLAGLMGWLHSGSNAGGWAAASASAAPLQRLLHACAGTRFQHMLSTCLPHCPLPVSASRLRAAGMQQRHRHPRGDEG